MSSLLDKFWQNNIWVKGGKAKKQTNSAVIGRLPSMNREEKKSKNEPT